MGERWRRWRRAYYELSIEELKDKRKIKTILYFLLELLSVCMLGFLLLFTLDICEWIVTVKYRDTLLLVLIVFGIVINICLLLYLKFHIDALDFARDKDHINLLIYLKQQENKEKDGK